jgi:hypothetical protein
MSSQAIEEGWEYYKVKKKTLWNIGKYKLWNIY